MNARKQEKKMDGRWAEAGWEMNKRWKENGRKMDGRWVDAGWEMDKR